MLPVKLCARVHVRQLTVNSRSGNMSMLQRFKFSFTPRCLWQYKAITYQSLHLVQYHHTKSEPKENQTVQNSASGNVNSNQEISISRQSRSKDATPNTTTKKQNKLRQIEWEKPHGHDTGIRLYNSLTRSKEPLILPAGRLATWYMCGPTVYDHAHIGHASSYVRTDIVRRIMINFFNIDVVLVMGVTDIDDKIIKRSKELKVNFLRLSKHFEKEFFNDMDAMKVLSPTVKTRVTEHIPHIIHFIKKIVDNGYAYSTPDGTVYFDVQKYGRYGQLYMHPTELPDSEIRVAVDRGKRSSRDFALWKAAKPEEPSWESPWGRGRPGWHIECSTMASAIFGPKLDIHSGGDDLRFPHHENEKAQSEACFCSNQWTNYWMHTGFLHQKNERTKMSKSLKNTIQVSQLLQHYTANQFRMFCMLRPYRQLVEYSEESMEKAVRIHTQWATFQTTADSYIQGQILCKPINEAYLLASLEETKEKIDRALRDDFDTPRAIQAMEELVRRANVELTPVVQHGSETSLRSPGVIAAIAAYVNRIMDLFGIQVSRKKTMTQSENEQKFGLVMDGVMRFRSEVRRYALDSNSSESPKPDCDTTKKEEELHAQQKVQPLLQACDDLRDDLSLIGIKIQDHVKEASWDIQEQTEKLPRKNPIQIKEKKVTPDKT